MLHITYIIYILSLYNTFILERLEERDSRGKKRFRFKIYESEGKIISAFAPINGQYINMLSEYDVTIWHVPY